MSNVLTIIDESTKKEFIDLAVKDCTEPDKKMRNELLFLKDIISQNNYLASIAQKDPESFRNAFVQLSLLDLSLNPKDSHCYLIPRNQRVCLDISYQGLIYLAQREKRIQYVVCDVVKDEYKQLKGDVEEVLYQGDKFIYKGKMTPPEHTGEVLNKYRSKSAPLGAYCAAKLYDGTWLIEIMDQEELRKVRSVSESYKRYTKDTTKYSKQQVPWLMWADEFCKKSVIKRASKYWPMVNINDSKFKEAVDISNKTDEFDFNSNADKVNNLIEDNKNAAAD